MNQIISEHIEQINKACGAHGIHVNIHGDIETMNGINIFVDNQCDTNRKEALNILNNKGGLSFTTCKKDFDMHAVLPKLLMDNGFKTVTLLTNDPTKCAPLRSVGISVTPHYLSTEINGMRIIPKWGYALGGFFPSAKGQQCSPV